MRIFQYGFGVALAVGAGVGFGVGCAAAGGGVGSGAGGSSAGCQADIDCKGTRICVSGMCVNPGAGGGSSGSAGMSVGSSASSATMTGSSSGGVLLDAGFDGFGSCASFHAAATQDPAAMLIVLQGSASMATSGKWPAAGSAIQQAIDLDLFDTMSLGLTSFPKGTTTPPDCLMGLFPNVYCSYYTGGNSDPFPVPIEPAGMLKSTAATGVRHDIVTWLSSHSPASQDLSNSSPVYDAMSAGYQVLSATNIAKRMLVLITDGGFDCTSVSNPMRPGISDGLCPDWEIPTTVNTLIANARTNAAAPVQTFVVGVPGSNTLPNEMQGLWTAAPYNMLLALSTYAVSGSPTTVPANCDSAATWSVGGANPAVPCHINLSGGNFNAMALANAIAEIRGKALGCTYNLPTPPLGQSINLGEVNVVETINGVEHLIPKRTNPSDTCLGNDPCWDYDVTDKVVLVGAGCTAVTGSVTTTVDIYVGCTTIMN